MPFEELCCLANRLSDRIHTLNLEKNRLNSELLNSENFNNHLLAKGTEAATDMYSRLAIGKADPADGASRLSLALAEKTQLEKKISELQDTLTVTIKEKNDDTKRVVDLKARLEERDEVQRSISEKLENVLKENEELKKFRDHLRDENVVLNIEYQTVKKKLFESEKLIDSLRKQILDYKNEKANLINAQNERDIRERISKETGAEMIKVASGSRVVSDRFETLVGNEELSLLSAPSCIPTDIEFSFTAHEAETTAIHWYCNSGPKDNYIATGSSCDRKLRIWRVSSNAGACKATLDGCNASITSIDTEADAILASSNDYAIRVWSLNHYRLLTCLTGHSNKVTAAKFLGTPRKIGSCSIDRTVKVWDVEKGACLLRLRNPSNCLTLAQCDGQLVTGHLDGKIRFWDPRKADSSNCNQTTASIRNKDTSDGPTCEVALQDCVSSLDVSRNNKIACLLKDNTIQCIDLRTLTVEQTLGHTNFRVDQNMMCRVKFSPDGRYLGCGSSEGAMFIWNIDAGGQLAAKLSGSPVRACCWSPDGQRIASIGKGKKATIWV